jgi:hypothetical protein
MPIPFHSHSSYFLQIFAEGYKLTSSSVKISFEILLSVKYIVLSQTSYFICLRVTCELNQGRVLIRIQSVNNNNNNNNSENT